MRPKDMMVWTLPQRTSVRTRSPSRSPRQARRPTPLLDVDPSTGACQYVCVRSSSPMVRAMRSKRARSHSPDVDVRGVDVNLR